MKLVLSGNPLFQSCSSKIPPKPSSPRGSQPDSNSKLSPGITPSTSEPGISCVPAIQLKKKPNVVSSFTPVAPDSRSQLSPGITPSTGDSGIGGVPAIQLKKKPNVVPFLTPFVVFAGLALLTVPLGLFLCKLKKANSSEPPSSLVIHPWTRLTRITHTGFQSPMTHTCMLVLAVVQVSPP
uniref:Uncharacterized protein n=1 Tax=Helianthus annuus TaxID=4232 RepID=A0A251TMN5_HELAN